MKRTLPYGAWESKIHAAHVAETGTGSTLSLTALQNDKKEIYWIERQSAEGGRQTIMQRSIDGSVSAILPTGFSARTKAQEYGGGDYCVGKGLIYFMNETDQCIYRLEIGHEPERITSAPEPGQEWRFADPVLAPNGAFLIVVRERHENQVINELVRISVDHSGEVKVLQSGADFYASPRISPDGRSLAWIEWNHPSMPWDGTELWVGHWDSRLNILEKKRIAGGISESIFQPEWGPSGELYYLSDASGWWNLYQVLDDEVDQITHLKADLGYPQWRFGYSRYGLLSDNRLVSIVTKDGIDGLLSIDPAAGDIKELPLPYTSIEPFLQIDEEDHLWVIAGSFQTFHAILRVDLEDMQVETICPISELELDEETISVPQSIRFPSTDSEQSFGLFYPPKNPQFQAPKGEKPPLIVTVHGGPTSAAKSHLQLEIQFWTSRGFGVVDVNYAGSTGYGRNFRNRLKGEWGVIDVTDCIQAAKHLVNGGIVDGNRLVIRGKSAGGYTSLCALTFHDYFKAGVSYYGVGDLKALDDETHKFESHYLDSLIGSGPETEKIYHDRSPLFHSESIRSPLLLFQGLKDRVVSPSQSELLLNALEKKRIIHAYVAYPEEGHGFRKADTIIHALRAEYAFLCEVFKIVPMEPLIDIHFGQQP